MDASVRICLLGPIEISAGGDSSPVPGAKLQSLLAMLGLAAPHVVSDDRLCDGLWGEDQPTKPANALQALVSHLRRLLGRGTVERRGCGYALAVDPDSIDVLRLERLVRDGRRAVADGDPHAAAELFRAAVALTRGPPLGQLVDTGFAVEASVRLTDLDVAAHEGLAEAELALGHHADVLAPLTALVLDHPLQEHLRALLVLALYRCGRQAEALNACAAARRFLREELGLEPGAELQALERAVLEQDAVLALPVTATATVGTGSSLPMPLTSFLGRQAELAELEAVAARSRLTTVVGPAGVGKTRLVQEFGRRGTAGELWYVELGRVLEPDAVDPAIADALGLGARGEGGDPHRIARCVEHIGSRPVTIILDNCEHVIATAARAAGALLGCPQLRVIATSREPLGIDGEHQVSIGPLDPASSCQLFADRARAVQPRFGASHDELTELCARLDGLPLAIELAAARAKTLPVAEITARLHDRFRLLRRVSWRPGLDRHAGLGAAIDWSYDLLFEDERRAFRRLALFTSGATIEAAEAVCGPEALDLVGRLVDRSLLVAELSSDEVRFTMLESLRDYGLARLVEAGELEEARRDVQAWSATSVDRSPSGGVGAALRTASAQQHR